MKKAKVVVLSLLFLVLILAAAAVVSELRPGLFKERNQAPGVSADAAVGKTDGADFVPAEPLAILLLGAGLVSLGLYANQKRRKYQ